MIAITVLISFHWFQRAYEEMRAEGIELGQMDGGYEINHYLIGSFDRPIQLNKRGFSFTDDE